MKKLISVVLSALLIICVAASCGKTDDTNDSKSRILFNINLEKYIELGEYENIPVDTSSDDFKEMYEEIIKSDIESNDLYVKKTSGKVKKGDTANIDYVGKKDGVAFEGGTAKGYDLEIGSGSFIDGFEDGLIGVSIGNTVDLNLTFPKDYSSADLAGKAVVFTVKVNYVKTDEGLEPKDYYKKLGFKTLNEYEESVKKTAIENYVVDTVLANSKIKDYPITEINRFYNDYKEYAESSIKSQYNMSLKDYLKNSGQTEKQFKDNAITNQVEPIVKQYMFVYALADALGIVIDEKAIDEQFEKMAEESKDEKVTADYLNEYYTSNYGDFYPEFITAYENVAEALYNNADIK